MKKILLTLILALGCIIGCSAQTYERSSNVSEPIVYQKFSDVVFGDIQTPTYIHFSVFVTKEVIVDPVYKYKFQITIVNHSRYYKNGSRLYMSGIRVFVNGATISGAYPNGFWSLIPYEEPTVIYWYKVNNPNNLNFSFTWENIQHY